MLEWIPHSKIRGGWEFYTHTSANADKLNGRPQPFGFLSVRPINCLFYATYLHHEILQYKLIVSDGCIDKRPKDWSDELVGHETGQH